jgi:hypothetical protein
VSQQLIREASELLDDLGKLIFQHEVFRELQGRFDTLRFLRVARDLRRLKEAHDDDTGSFPGDIPPDTD